MDYIERVLYVKCCIITVVALYLFVDLRFYPRAWLREIDSHDSQGGND